MPLLWKCRYIVPKGMPFDACTQEDITLMINHINSVSRDSLNGHTPFRLSQYLLDSSLHEYFHLLEIPLDEVCLNIACLYQCTYQTVRACICPVGCVLAFLP